MNPLELNKDTEIVPNEPIETVISEVNEMVEAENPTAQTVSPAEAIEITTETTTTSEENAEPKTSKMPDYNLFSKAELVEALKLLLDKEIASIRDEVEVIKQSFYKRAKADTEEQKRKFIEEGGEEENFVPKKDDFEDALKLLLNEYRTRKSAYTSQLEAEKENNLIQKQHIIEQMKSLVEKNDDVSIHIGEFKALQQKWKTIGQVPSKYVTELWKQYNLNQEAFWDLIKINNELREYDFKKNLEAKTLICEQAERLAADTNVLDAFQQLQKLHSEWHETGPVSRELRDQIWNRFREASGTINKKYQMFFDTVREKEELNMKAKIELIEKIEAFDCSVLNNFKAWEDALSVFKAWQEEWRAIGFAPRRENQALYERYRKACDVFYDAKNLYYKEAKVIMNQNLDVKKDLCKQAEALKNSTDWKGTTEKIIHLQREWKKAGPVLKRNSDELWKRFIAACDYFFEQKNKNFSDLKNVEIQNLAKKKEITEKIALIEKKSNTEETQAEFRALMAEWNSIGHVPFKEKDQVYTDYRATIDKIFTYLNVDSSQRRLDSFKNNLKEISAQGENKLYREREKLVRAYEHLKSEIATYENNIGFLTSSSKKGGGLIREMERKIEALKDESKLIEQKINLLDEKV